MCISVECGATKTKVIKSKKKKGLEMSKAIGELMKTSYLKCGKSEGSSRDVNLVFQSDWLSGATCLNQSHSEVIYHTQTVPGLHLFLISYTDAPWLNLNYSSFSSFDSLTLFFPIHSKIFMLFLGNGPINLNQNPNLYVKISKLVLILLAIKFPSQQGILWSLFS